MRKCQNANHISQKFLYFKRKYAAIRQAWKSRFPIQTFYVWTIFYLRVALNISTTGKKVLQLSVLILEVPAILLQIAWAGGHSHCDYSAVHTEAFHFLGMKCYFAGVTLQPL